MAPMDGRTISVQFVLDRVAIKPAPRGREPEQRANWEIVRGSYGIHWPDVDKDLSTEGRAVQFCAFGRP
jgi:hypothetical protein